MKFLRSLALTAVALLAIAGVTRADNPFTQFILNAPNVTSPPAGDLVPIVDSGAMKHTTVQALTHVGVASFNTRTGDVTLSAGDLGALLTFGCPSHEWANSLNVAGTFNCGQPSFADVSGTISPAQLPAATTTSLGAVEAIASVAHEFVQYIDNTGLPHLAQAAFTDLSGSLAASQMPALTGDVTSSAGSTATTLANSGVTAGTYTNATVTVDVKGRVTAASNGAASASVSLVGDARNLSIVQASTTTLTIAADQIAMATALNGTAYLEASASHTLNGATTGANGLDTGTLAASTWYCLYDITKGDGATFASLGYKAATPGSCPTIYPGVNMPSGFDASALIGIWPTDGSSHFVKAYIVGRHLNYDAPQAIFTATTGVTSVTAQSVSAAVPPGAKTADIILGSNAGAGTDMALSVAGSANGAGLGTIISVTNGHQYSAPGLPALYGAAKFKGVPLVASQTVYWIVNSTTASAYYMYATGYSF